MRQLRGNRNNGICRGHTPDTCDGEDMVQPAKLLCSCHGDVMLEAKPSCAGSNPVRGTIFCKVCNKETTNKKYCSSKCGVKIKAASFAKWEKRLRESSNQ